MPKPLLYISMSSFKLFLEQEQITVYHGSRSSGLDGLNASMPPYEGGIGKGVYVGLYPKTAEFYGQYVYELRTNFGWDSILGIGHSDGDNYIPIEEREGHSILIGEHIPPFAFDVKGKRYAVVTGSGWPNDEDEKELGHYGELISLESIGEVAQQAGHKAVYVVGIRYGSSVNEEMLVFDANNLSFVRELK